MARPRNKIVREVEFSPAKMLALLGEGLSKQAREPNMLGYVPHEKQVLFHNALDRRKLYIGGNRSGKTTGGVVEDLWWITHRHPYRHIPNIPIHGRALAVSFNLAEKILLSAIKRWIIPSDLINGSWTDSYGVAARTLTLNNGSTLEFKSYDQDVQEMAGTSRHFVHFDEPPPKVIFAENQLRLLDRYGDFEGSGSWWMTYTPAYGMDWTYDEIYMPGKETGSPLVVEVDMADNPHLDPDAIKFFLNNLSDDEREARQHGRYVQLGGNVFKDFGPQHVLNEADIHEIWPEGKLPSNWLLYFSLDHGFNAPTAAYWHAVGPDNTVITFAEHYRAEMTIDDHAKVIHRVEKSLGRVPDFRVGDPALVQRSGITGTSVLWEYAERGIIIAVEHIPKEPSIGIIKMRQHMRTNPRTRRPYWMIYNCPSLVKELERIHFKTFASLKIRDDNNVLETVHKKDDHAFDSCKYFFTQRPDLRPEEDGVVRDSDFLPGTLAATMFSEPLPTFSPVKDFWRTENVIDELGFEEYD